MNKYIQEFIRVTNMGGRYLTTFGFNEVSKYTSTKIIKNLNHDWIQLIRSYGLLDELYDYAVEEYKKFSYKNKKANSTTFTRQHKYLKQHLFNNGLDIKEVRRRAGFINEHYKGCYNYEMLYDNFKNVALKVNGIPSITQFKKYTKILPSIYCDYLGIKGQIWDEVLKRFVKDKETLNNYLNERNRIYKEKSVVALMEARKEPIPDEVLEDEFKRVFDMYISAYGTHPTRRIFNEVSKFNDMTYRKRYKLRWSEIAVKYGYEFTEKNIREKICLEMVKQILKSDYKRNYTFSWLIGIKGKHLYCDGYFKDFNLVVEFDGKQHRIPVSKFGGEERFKKDKLNDAIKEQLIKEHKIKFIRIASNEKWQDKLYLKQRLQEVLN